MKISVAICCYLVSKYQHWFENNNSKWGYQLYESNKFWKLSNSVEKNKNYGILAQQTAAVPLPDKNCENNTVSKYFKKYTLVKKKRVSGCCFAVQCTGGHYNGWYYIWIQW